MSVQSLAWGDRAQQSGRRIGTSIYALGPALFNLFALNRFFLKVAVTLAPNKFSVKCYDGDELQSGA